MPLSSIEILLESTVRILCDSRPEKTADAAYLFAQTRYNQSSVIAAAKEILRLETARRILILGSEGSPGYPGFESWRRELVDSGVNEARIGKVQLKNSECHNTLTEALALVHHTREAQYDSIVVSAAPFHQMRAFMTTVTVALRHYPRLKIFSHSGIPLDWNQPTVHSQGSMKAPRQALIRTEYERIARYCVKGDLATFEVVLNYLKHRDEPYARR